MRTVPFNHVATVKLDGPTRRALHETAVAEGTSASEIIRRSIRKFCDSMKPPPGGSTCVSEDRVAA